MSCHRDFRTGPSSGMGFGPGSNYGGCGRGHWKPLEIVAMILGFIVFWPIGLAIVLFKVWQRKYGYEGDVFAFAQERAADLQARWRDATGAERKPSGGWRGPGFMRSSGNVAFDDWRESELARLEEERRKLAEAEREFAEHIEKLRRAKDREEFESFMQARRNGGTQPTS